jgi:hypothetical protein
MWNDYLYSNSQLIQDNVKIELKLTSAKNDNYDDYDDFLGTDTNILKKSDDNSNDQGKKEDFYKRIEADVYEQKNNAMHMYTLQNSSKSSEGH